MTIAQALVPSSYSPFFDRSPRIRALRTGIDNVADTDATVLIRDEGDRGPGDPRSQRVQLLGAEIPRRRERPSVRHSWKCSSAGVETAPRPRGFSPAYYLLQDVDRF